MTYCVRIGWFWAALNARTSMQKSEAFVLTRVAVVSHMLFNTTMVA
jgi:hypothetical protein